MGSVDDRHLLATRLSKLGCDIVELALGCGGSLLGGEFYICLSMVMLIKQATTSLEVYKYNVPLRFTVDLMLAKCNVFQLLFAGSTANPTADIIVSGPPL